MFEDDEHNAGGIIVKHDAKDIEAGETMVLTLADSNVLDDLGKEMNDTEDQLENVDLLNAEKKAYAEKQKKSAYDVYDDLEGKQMDLLPQYSKENLEFTRKEGFRLDSGGQAASTEDDILADLDLEEELGGEDAGMHGLRVQSDWEEPKRKRRKRDAQPRATPQKLLNELLEREKKLAEAKQEDVKVKIEADAPARRPVWAERAEAQAECMVFDPTEEFCADVADQDKEIMRQQKIEALQEKREEQKRERIYRGRKRSRAAFETSADLAHHKEEAIKVEEVSDDEEDDEAILDAVGEEEREKIRKAQEEAQKKEEEYIVNLHETDVFDEPKVAKGLGETMKLIQEKGWIEREWGGRDNDKVIDTTVNDVAPDVHIPRLDQFGREMTQKEAYRQLCHVFHGKKVGKKKEEKKLRKMGEDQKVRSMKAEDTPLNSTETLRRTTKLTKQAFVVIQGSSGK